MYDRFLAVPKTSFFLFGPRGTGKTTWLQHIFPKAACRTLKELKQLGVIDEAVTVYLGDSEQRDGPIHIYPLKDFSKYIAQGKII